MYAIGAAFESVGLIPVVVSPERFRTSRQLWSYSGLGIVMRSSSDWVRAGNRWVRSEVAKNRGLNPRRNSTLKAIFKGAATTEITNLGSDPLRGDYERLLEQGTKPNLAKLTLEAPGSVRPSATSKAIIHARRSGRCVGLVANEHAVPWPQRRVRFEGEHPLDRWHAAEAAHAPRIDYAPTRLLKAGTTVDVTCDYDNPTDQSLRFGESAATNEMCIFSGLYYGARSCEPADDGAHHDSKDGSRIVFSEERLTNSTARRQCSPCRTPDRESFLVAFRSQSAWPPSPSVA
jgi:hypothetical protein